MKLCENCPNDFECGGNCPFNISDYEERWRARLDYGLGELKAVRDFIIGSTPSEEERSNPYFMLGYNRENELVCDPLRRDPFCFIQSHPCPEVGYDPFDDEYVMD